MTRSLSLVLLTGWFVLQPQFLPAQRQMEHLDRGLVAVPKDDGSVFLSWRLLGTDPTDVAFHLYRYQGDNEPAKLNNTPISDATCFVDQSPTKNARYSLKPLLNGTEGAEFLSEPIEI